MRQNPHVRICGGPGSATTLVYPTLVRRHVDPNVGGGGRGQRSLRRWRRGHLRLRHRAPPRRREDAGESLVLDGSGLSSSNLVTPTTVVRVLAHALAQPWGRTLVEALAGPGAGTLAAWPRVPPIAAKTGTLRHTVALAGILDPGPNAPVIFCYFVNHHPERRWAARGEIASALRRWRTFSTSR